MSAKYELKKTTSGQFIFNLKAPNGQVVLASEQYTTKASAKNGIESVKKHSVDLNNFIRKTSVAGEPYFLVKAGNGEIIGSSEMYSTDEAREKGIASVHKNGPVAAVEEKE